MFREEVTDEEKINKAAELAKGAAQKIGLDPNAIATAEAAAIGQASALAAMGTPKVTIDGGHVDTVGTVDTIDRISQDVGIYQR